MRVITLTVALGADEARGEARVSRGRRRRRVRQSLAGRAAGVGGRGDAPPPAVRAADPIGRQRAQPDARHAAADGEGKLGTELRTLSGVGRGVMVFYLNAASSLKSSKQHSEHSTRPRGESPM